MKKLLDDVTAFHKATDTHISNTVMFPSLDRIDLRKRLIAEEVKETMKAIDDRDIVEVADGLADIIYVVVGTAIEFGIPLDKVWEEVQKSNMAKVNPATGKVLLRVDGKILKPDGWKGPDIRKALGFSEP